MGKVIDINDFRKKIADTEFPYSMHVCTDDDGVAWYEFSCSYTDQSGKKFSFEIWAKNQIDAENRISCIRGNAVVDGQIFQLIDK